MRRFSLSLLAGCCLLAAGSASAGELRLSDKQMDNVTAGFFQLGDFGGLFDIFFPQTPTPTGPVVIDDDGIPVPVRTVEREVVVQNGVRTEFLVQESLVPGRLTQTTLTSEFSRTLSGSGSAGSGGIFSSLQQQ